MREINKMCEREKNRHKTVNIKQKTERKRASDYGENTEKFSLRI